jgi:cysteine-rich repeat protein
VKERGETCDDGNQNNDDGCNQLCQFVPIPGTICGNAVREVGEQCDDGNLAAGDGCSGACQNEDIVDGNNGQGQAAGQNADPLIPIVVNPDQADPNQVNPNQDPVNGSEENSNVSSTPSVLAPVLEGYDKKASLTKNVTVIVQNVSKNVVNTVKFLAAETKVVGDLVQKAADNPEVEKVTETVIVPTTVAVVVASVAPSLASVAIPLLRFLFLQPLLLFGRKKREEWGQIYNTLTKLPVIWR